MPANTWRAFVSEHKGQGYTMKELSGMYREKAGPVKKKRSQKKDKRETDETVHTQCTRNKTESHCGGNPMCTWQNKAKRCISRPGTKSEGLVFSGPFGQF